MANTEAQFRVEIVKSFSRRGAHALSINDRFIIGHPDVYTRMRGFGAIWLELKFLRYVHQQIKYPIRMTPAQRAFLTHEQNAGGYAGWVICARIEDPRVWIVMAGADPNQSYAVYGLNMVEQKHQGERLEWSPDRILGRIREEIKRDRER